MKKICGVYGLFNTKTGRVYIGSSIDIETRSFWHKVSLESRTLRLGDRRRALARDWHKLGPESFAFVVLERTRSFQTRNDSRLLVREQFWLNQFKDLYNKNRNASGEGNKFSKSVRKRISNAAKSIGADPEEKKRRSIRAKKQHKAGKFGRKTWSDETKEMVKKKLKVKFNEPEYRKVATQRLRAASNNYDSAEMSRRSYCRKKYQK